MLVYIPIFLLFLISVIIVVLDRVGVRTGYLWFLAIGAGFIVWVLVLISRTQIPLHIALMQWRPEELFTSTPTLLLDNISWAYAVVITVIPIAVFLTDVVQVEDVDPEAWATGLAMTGLGLLAVLAENPLTLILAWTILDMTETFMLLQRVTTSEQRERVVISFSVRLVGILLMLVASVLAISEAGNLSFDAIPKNISGLILLAVGLRLGVLPPHQPFFQEPPLRRGLGTIVRLTTVASSLVVLARVAVVGVPGQWEPYVLVFAVLATMYAAFAWNQAKDELDGRPYWILGVATLSLVSAVLGLPDSSLAWGLALILSGGILFLMSYKNRFMQALGVLGAIGSSLLPFSPAWRAAELFDELGVVLSVLFIIGHALLLLGYFRQVFNRSTQVEILEPWMLIVYPLGIGLLPVTHWVLSWSLGLTYQASMSIQSIGFWVGFASLLIIVVLAIIRRLSISMPQSLETTIRRSLSLEWLYRLFWWFYRRIGQLFTSISQILEGEGGILWALLILVLLISLITQQSGAG